jgi:biopolymer transport protein ExbD
VNLRPRVRNEPEIMLIPLIDILLMLLIFFMLATTFKHTADISINLPEASEQKLPDTEAKTLEITIDEEGNFYVDRQQVVNREVNTVKRALEKVSGGDKEMIVVISADANTPTQAVVTAMDAARQIGLIHVTIAAQWESQSQGQNP